MSSHWYPRFTHWYTSSTTLDTADNGQECEQQSHIYANTVVEWYSVMSQLVGLSASGEVSTSNSGVSGVTKVGLIGRGNWEDITLET